MNEKLKIVVVGGNAAGPAAAAKAKRVNPSAEVTLFEASNFISTGTCEIPYVLSGEIKKYEDIILFTSESFKEKKDVNVFTNHFVEEINRREKFIIVKNLKENKSFNFDYDKLILTTGSIAKIPKEFSASLKNVFTLKNIGDLLKINDYLKSNKIKNVCIFGSSYLGLEAADAFNQLGCEVSMIEKENLPMPSEEPEIQHLILELLNKNKINFFESALSPRIIISDKDEKIKRININERIIETDLILLAIGFYPNIDLAKKAKLEIGKSGGIKVNRKLQTSDFNIYAAGDNIEIQNFITNKFEYFPLASIARDYGHAAGENAAGGNKRIDPIVRNIGVKIFDKFNVSIGLTSKQAKENKIIFDSVYSIASNLVEVMPQSEKVFGKLIFEKNSKRILGASFLGGKETAGYGDLISALIKSKQPADILSKIDFNYTPPLSPYKNLLSILGRKIN